jgi:Fuc2NAc and GlcNAc transferase
MSLPAFVIVLLATTFIFSYWLTGRVRRYAITRLVDIPNSRSSHSNPTPRGGGLAIVVAFSVALCLWQWVVGMSDSLKWALAGAAPVAAVGFWDDHGHVSARLRISIHLLAAVWAVLWLGGAAQIAVNGSGVEVGHLGSIMAVVGIVWMLNLFNFMDGIDGIAGSEAVFVSGAGAALSWFSRDMGSQAPLLMFFSAACGGFLVRNWPPARIFMGDVGSGFVGFAIGVFILVSATREGLSLVVWLLLTAVFLVDSTYTLIKRVATGQRWAEAHRSHAYQHATQLFGSHRIVTLAVWAINLCWLLPLAAAAVYWPKAELYLFAVGYLPLLILVQRFGAGEKNWPEVGRGAAGE